MEEKGAQRDAVVGAVIDNLMGEGLPVFDVDGVRIGRVSRYDLEAGYMVVEQGALARRRLYLPFHLMRTLTPKEFSLSVSTAGLTDDYLLPPAIKPVVEEWTNPLTGCAEAVIWHEIHSGYDERLVRIMPVSLDEVVNGVTLGMTVLDVDGDYVGEIIDRDEERLTVRDDIAGDTIQIVPFGVVLGVDLDNLEVTLLIPKLALPRYAFTPEMNGQGTDTDSEDG
jgi:hypothetical protein